MDTATKPVPLSSDTLWDARGVRVNATARSHPTAVAELLTVKEAAELLRVNVKTIHKLLVSGDLPHHRFGRVIRIPSRVLLSTRKSV
jgi:excisionase family DNA binding protein